MEVRNAHQEELDALAKVWHESWNDAHAAIVPAELTRLRTLESFREGLQAALHSVRVVGPRGAPLGFYLLKDDELYLLFVTASARATGVAATLMADAEAQLARAGVETAWLACAVGNERAAKFYEKCGWRRTGTFINELEAPADKIQVEVWRYEKSLLSER
jgi:GNAT superfamily N-acetyltransferase